MIMVSSCELTAAMVRLRGTGLLKDYKPRAYGHGKKVCALSAGRCLLNSEEIQAGEFSDVGVLFPSRGQ